MILAKSISEARANRTHRIHPDGRESWVSRFFTASAERPDTPAAFLVEKAANAIVPPHFHEVNQFQVIVEGYGKLGKQDVQPFTMHYTNSYTGYGPIQAEAGGIAFFTLRNRFDPGGARYFPQGRSFMKPAPKRHRLSDHLALSDTATLLNRRIDVLETVLTPEADGLAAWFLRAPAGATVQMPDPTKGGGQYMLVAGGTLRHQGLDLPRFSCVYVSADEKPLCLEAGPDGLEALIMQFPVDAPARVAP